MIRYKLRTLLIVLAAVPVIAAYAVWCAVLIRDNNKAMREAYERAQAAHEANKEYEANNEPGK
jgi:hypothetical protein